jgi:hypothetical protein
MKLSTYSKLFKSLPCNDAQEYLETQKNIKQAWANCERGDWMWWAILEADIKISGGLCNAFIEDCKTRAYAYAYAYARAYAYAYAYARAYAYAYARAYAYAYARAYAKESKLQAEWIKNNIPCPF